MPALLSHHSLTGFQGSLPHFFILFLKHKTSVLCFNSTRVASPDPSIKIYIFQNPIFSPSFYFTFNVFSPLNFSCGLDLSANSRQHNPWNKKNRGFLHYIAFLSVFPLKKLQNDDKWSPWQWMGLEQNQLPRVNAFSSTFIIIIHAVPVLTSCFLFTLKFY